MRRRAIELDAPRARSRARRGVSLIEVMIVVSIGAVILGMCVTTMHLLLRLERDQARSVRLTVTLSRLRHVFSEDVHAAKRVALDPPGPSGSVLNLSGPDDLKVAYRAEEHSLIRIESEGDRVAHQDVFHLPPGSELSFEEEPSGAPLVRLRMEIAASVPHDMAGSGKGTGRSPPPRSLMIEAELDRERRYSGRAP